MLVDQKITGFSTRYLSISRQTLRHTDIDTPPAFDSDSDAMGWLFLQAPHTASVLFISGQPASQQSGAPAAKVYETCQNFAPRQTTIPLSDPQTGPLGKILITKAPPCLDYSTVHSAEIGWNTKVVCITVPTPSE